MMEREYSEPSEVVKCLVLGWLLDPAMHQRGRPSCPCGFVGGSRNIRQHRHACGVWTAYVYYDRWRCHGVDVEAQEEDAW
jgi:hypothetical protein